MLNIFDKIARKAISGWRFLYLNIKYIKKDYTIKNKEEKYAIVNLDSKIKTEDYSRYFYTICIVLRYAGYNIIIKANWRDFKTFKKPFDFKKLLLEQKYTLVRNCSTPLNTIVLVQPGATNHTIHLTYGFHLTHKLNNMIESGQIDCVAPYPAYPMQFKFFSDQKYLAEVRKSSRTIKIFFAGDLGKIRYLNEKLKKFFNIIPRLEVINFIFSNFQCRKLQNEEDKIVLKQLLSSDVYNNETVISEVKSNEEDWLKILSKADFFICPPGARMPWCHNCVEAMSVGTIPILEYNDSFYPPLENMKNCLSFKNYEELAMVIKKALAMEPSEIEVIRNNVIDYYTNYLSVDSILNKIKTFTASQKQDLKVAFPFISTKKEWLAVLPFHSPEELKQLGISK